MRLFNTLLQEIEGNQDDIIRRDCQPFLVETKGNILFRGSVQHIKGIKKIDPRSDRRPTDTPGWAHKMLDGAFKKKFGWNARSEGVFATRSINNAEVYGVAYEFYPIGKFKYVWSPRIDDLYDALSFKTWFNHPENLQDDDFNRDNILSWMHGIREWIHFEQPGRTLDMNVNELLQYVINLVVNTYIDRRLYDATKASTSGLSKEVSFKCDSYYLLERFNYRDKLNL